MRKLENLFFLDKIYKDPKPTINFNPKHSYLSKVCGLLANDQVNR